MSVGKKYNTKDLTNYEFPIDSHGDESYIKFPYPLEAYITVSHRLYGYGH